MLADLLAGWLAGLQHTNTPPATNQHSYDFLTFFIYYFLVFKTFVICLAGWLADCFVDWIELKLDW